MKFRAFSLYHSLANLIIFSLLKDILYPIKKPSYYLALITQVKD
jgi:hypothetical protein